MTISAKFKDAFMAGYTVTPVSQSNSSVASIADKTHVRLERNSVDYLNFYNHALVSVNGFYHICDTDGIKGLMVMDAVKSLNISKQNQIGIFSFKDICSLKTYPINKNNLITSNNGTVKIVINKDINNKTVVLCIGGYLYFQDPLTFFNVNDNIFKIDFNQISLLDRYYESKKYIDLSKLPIDFAITNNQQISVSHLLADECLKEYMTLSQSFIIVLGTPKININKRHVKKTGFPGMYISYSLPNLPLVTNFGKHNEYWYQKEDDHYAINVYDNIVENRIFDTMLKEKQITVSDQRRPDIPGSLSQAYFLEITKV
jgi:hypothetical protein